MYQDNNNFKSHLNAEDNLLISRLSDIVELCEHRNIPKFTFFLDEGQRTLSDEYLKSIKASNYSFYGGYDGAKRTVLGIFPSFMEVDTNDFPFKIIKFSYRKMDKLQHRDFLGALMSLKIKREVLGDILVDEGAAIAFIYNTAVDAILDECTKIGSVGVKTSIIDEVEFIPNEEFSEISGTVSSLRIDSVLSFSTKQSREKAALFVKSVGVDINYKKIYSPDTHINAGDIFSARGYGKFILDNINGITKKGRIHISVKKYI